MMIKLEAFPAAGPGGEMRRHDVPHKSPRVNSLGWVQRSEKSAQRAMTPGSITLCFL
jgi:hypothetical protein